MPLPPSLLDMNDTTTITPHNIKPILVNNSIYIDPSIPISLNKNNNTNHHMTNSNNNNTSQQPAINKIESSIRSVYSPLDRSIYRMSAVDMIRQHYHPQEMLLQVNSLDDEYSTSSSFDSTNSSVSDHPIMMTTAPTLETTTTTSISHSHHPHSITNNNKSSKKKKSYRRLLRELRKLRSENEQLNCSVNLLKEDLRNEKESRLIADQCHKKFFDDAMDKHTQLEYEIMDQKDLIDSLQSRLNDTTLSSSSSLSTFHSSNNNNNNNNEEVVDCSLWNFEDIDCTFEKHQQVYSSTLDDQKKNHLINDDDDDEEKEDYSPQQQQQQNQQDQFEELAESYLRQALIANLTSARTNLELDDLILKYDPSPERILKTLADTFLGWICDTIHTCSITSTTTSVLLKTSSSSSPSSTFIIEKNENKNDPTTTAAILAVKKLLVTQIQSTFKTFWKNVFEKHVHNDLDQYQFLQEIEKKFHHYYHQHQDQISHHELQSIIQNFQILLMMLYKHDILESEAITIWWHNDDNKNDSGNDLFGNQLRDTTKKFVEWVDEADEEESDDEDDDDDNEEEDDDDIEEDDDDDDDDLVYNENDIIHFSNDNDDDTITPSIYITPSPPQQITEKKKKSVTIQV
ncbi:unnamed protein product [Cunninghamella blakesleeana]